MEITSAPSRGLETSPLKAHSSSYQNKTYLQQSSKHSLNIIISHGPLIFSFISIFSQIAVFCAKSLLPLRLYVWIIGGLTLTLDLKFTLSSRDKVKCRKLLVHLIDRFPCSFIVRQPLLFHQPFISSQFTTPPIP